MSKKLENKRKGKFPNLQQLKKAGTKIYALIYCRVSSDRQASEGNGLSSQEQRCRIYAEQNNYIVEKVFQDTASGGGDYKNRQGQVDLLEHIDKNPVKSFVVIVDDISRVARDAQAHFQLRLLLKQRGVDVASPNFNFGDSPEDEMIEGVMAMVSQYQRKGNARQVIQKQKARLEAGYWAFGSKKGYNMIKHPEHGKILVPNKLGLEVLKPALEGFANGTFVRKIDVCKFLVEKGFWKNQYPSAYIDKLTPILKDPAHVGDIEYLSWEVTRRKGHHQGIISEETFDLIQARLGKKAVRSIRTDTSETFPLRGLLVCSGCGKAITGANSKARGKLFPYYFCQNGNCEFGKKSIRKQVIETEFDSLLKKVKLKPEVSRVIQTVFDRVWSDEIKKISSEETSANTSKLQIEAKIKKLTEMVIGAKSEKVKEVYEKQLEDSAVELESLSSNISIRELDMSIPYRNALNKAVGLVKSPYSVWNKLPILEKHRLFFFIFDEKLAYSKKEGYRNDNPPSAVRLFEEFVTSNTLDVEKPALKPGANKF